MSARFLQQVTETLQQQHERIYCQRMANMPMVNSAIGVHTIGFQQWRGNMIGILITPWCMNLLCLPGDAEDWSDQRNLIKVDREFPAGTYEFINSFDPELGKYQMCSLFSPMFDFPSDEVAVETATLIMRDLLIPQHQIQKTAEPRPTVPLASEAPAQSIEAAEPARKPISRRQLLRGALQMSSDA